MVGGIRSVILCVADIGQHNTFGVCVRVRVCVYGTKIME